MIRGLEKNRGNRTIWRGNVAVAAWRGRPRLNTHTQRRDTSQQKSMRSGFFLERKYLSGSVTQSIWGRDWWKRENFLVITIYTSGDFSNIFQEKYSSCCYYNAIVLLNNPNMDNSWIPLTLRGWGRVNSWTNVQFFADTAFYSRAPRSIIPFHIHWRRRWHGTTSAEATPSLRWQHHCQCW